MTVPITAAMHALLDGADELPRFAEVRLRARGEFTETYAAREFATGRAVALKILTAQAPPFAAEALQREADHMRMLRGHPHVLTLHQRTELPDRRPVLVLDDCPGSVASAMRQGLTIPAAVSIVIKIAGALETTHRGGFVHCAVRPQNLLFTVAGEPVLADFSAALPMRGDQVLGLHETSPHTAPELLLGDGTSAATDVYGLASTLYEMVAGRAAFRAYDRESPAAMSLRILAGGVRPVLREQVPLELSDLLVWAMAPDPAERPPGAAWLAEELGRVEQHNGWPRTRIVIREPKRAPGRRRRWQRTKPS